MWIMGRLSRERNVFVRVGFFFFFYSIRERRKLSVQLSRHNRSRTLRERAIICVLRVVKSVSVL